MRSYVAASLLCVCPTAHVRAKTETPLIHYCRKMSLRPMLSEQRRKSLQHMYSLVGSHSAVKLCRWNKSMMRGRGGCYKWTMYGIRSHQCMEATPSMACANKCTFCWRLNTNPTATEWKWEVDDPSELVDKMLAVQRALIQNAKGMPGVTEEAFQEAMSPRHCALSLVGEPIIYLRVNEFVKCLHDKKISTFLVNNGQFPDCIATLAPVTQLYLSVDAPTKELMAKVDRPVFPDFWERFNLSVGLMREKKQRTTFRLTMMDHVNMGEEHIDAYKDLFERGLPDFIELKALTPAFSGRKTFLRIQNVPTYEALLGYGEKLCRSIMGGVEYDVACGHEHSSCVLLARRRFNINGVWHTWIDFEQFHRLAAAGSEFTSMDYVTETPAWAVAGSPSKGFDPSQRRHMTNKRKQHMDPHNAR